MQSYLDRWYADFNVVFTLTRPTSGQFYTEVVSSGGGAWCGVDAKVAGVAPFLCKDIAGGVAYTFMGGEDAKQTAVIIAQEQAHLVGLEHTASEAGSDAAHHVHQLRRLRRTPATRSRTIAATAPRRTPTR